ncbi:MAG: TonB-dependent receptor, partial [Pseudorhodoplanes sp.]
RTQSLAAYAFNEFKFSETWRAQLAGRIESNRVTGSSPDIPSGDLATSDRTRNFLPKSGSIGLLHDLPWDMVGSVTAQYVERAPRAPELFSRGGHDATGTFDIGNPNLNMEVAKSLEIGLKRAKGPFRFEANAYYTRFDGFIFRRLTGEMCDDDFASCTPGGAGTELNQAIYSQRDAIFRGGEFQFQWDVAPMGSGLFGIDGQYDFVRATFTDGSNVPRIPPQRLGGGVYWRNANWLARVNLLHAFSQNDVSANETGTPGYDNLRAQISYTEKLKNDPSGIKQFTVGISGDNLLDQAMRNAVSYTKNEVLMPGRTVRVFASVKY